MAFTYKSKRMAYDNISVGNATGRENIIAAGESPTGDFTTAPSRDSGGNTSTSVLAIARRENLIADPNRVSDDVPIVPGSTSATSGYSSGTSVTSSFPEVVG